MRSLPLALVLVGCGPWDSLKVHATYPSLLKVVKAIFKLYFCFFKGIHYFAGPCVERLMILFGTNNICNAFFHHLCFNSYQLICWFLCKIVLDLYNCIHFFFQFVDDDGKCYLEINYTFDIRKDWANVEIPKTP